MTESLVAVADGAFTFDRQEVVEGLLARFPGAAHVPERSHPEVATDRVEVPADDVPGYALAVDLLTGGRGVGIDGDDVHLAAAALVVLAGTVGFPADGTVVVVQWDTELVPLLPDATEAGLVERAALWR